MNPNIKKTAVFSTFNKSALTGVFTMSAHIQEQKRLDKVRVRENKINSLLDLPLTPEPAPVCNDVSEFDLMLLAHMIPLVEAKLEAHAKAEVDAICQEMFKPKPYQAGSMLKGVSPAKPNLFDMFNDIKKGLN